MSSTANFVEAAWAQARAEADRCVGCGDCFTACPMPAPAGLAAEAGGPAIAGLLDLVRGGPGTAEAARWAAVCTGSGSCIPACSHGVNPRFLVKMADIAAKRQAADPAAVKAASAAGFVKMARSANSFEALMLDEAAAGRLRPPPGPVEAVPDVTFWTGCNVIKTPHIALLCLDVMDALGVSYAVRGGTGTCCGIYQTRGGDLAMAGRAADATARKLAEPGAAEVLTWCPSCYTQFTELVLPARAAAGEDDPFGMTPFLAFLDRRLDALRPLFRHRVEKRVALHERPGLPQVMQAARRILGSIPGLELVEIDVPRVGLMANYLSVLPGFKAATEQTELAACAAAGVTTLATVYHACHRDICAYEDGRPFEIVNFMELVAETMGLDPRPDDYKRLKLLGDIDAVMAETAPAISAKGLDPAPLRAVLAADMALPVDGGRR